MRTESDEERGLRVLVTGGSGFIGTHLIERLLERGDRVLNVDKAPPKLEAHSSSWIRCDILDAGALGQHAEAFEPDVVIHLAARTDTDGRALEDYQDNTTGTSNLIEVIEATPTVRRVVMTSTQFVLGPGRLPTSDVDYAPHTVYGQSKVVTEELTRESGMDAVWTIVRPTNVWGPWHPRYPQEFWRVLKRGVYVHPGGRQPIRCYGYVENVVWQMLEIVEKAESVVRGKTFYVGDPPIRLIEWVDRFSRALAGRPARIVPRSFVRTLALAGDGLAVAGVRFPITSSRFRSMTQDYPTPMEPTIEALGDPPFSMDDGVERTVDWLRHVGFFDD